jgi:hypothetical protein
MTIIKDCIQKCEHNIHCIYIPTKLSVCCVGDYNVQKNPPLTLTMIRTKTILFSHPISSKHWHYIILLSLPSASSCSGFLSKLRITFLLTISMPHMYYLPYYDFVNNILWRVTDMKITTVSSTSLYSCLPPNQIFSSPPCCHKPSICVLRKTPNFTPTQNDMKNVSSIDEYMQHSELNGSKYCLNISCRLFIPHPPRSWSFSNFIRI